jgi:hypothetical protein
MRPQGTTDTHQTHDHHILSPPRPVLIGAGAVLLWIALVVGSDELWRHAFGFAEMDAWALAVGLDAYIALVVAILAGAAFMITHERERR